MWTATYGKTTTFTTSATKTMLAPTSCPEFDNSLNQRPARSGTPCTACTPVSAGAVSGSCPGPVCTPSNRRTSMIKPRLRLRAVSRPISPDPPRSFPMERGHKVQQFGNMLRLSTPPAPPTDLDENELAGHQPHWHCPSPSMLPSMVPDAAHMLTIHVSPSSTTGVKRSLDDAPPAGTVASLSTPLEKMAKQQAPGAPDSLSGGFALLTSVDSSALAHLHGLFMAI